MDLNSRTQLYGVLGDPIEHSLSPLIHNAAFRHFKLNAVYLAFRVAPEALGLAFEGLRAMEIRGVNLTIPFKQTAIEFIDEIPEDLDRATGAINTVVNRDGELYGYNTDGVGFLTSLQEDLRFDPEGKTALVLGAGGSSCGVVFALARAHADRILVLNRTQERAQGLKDFAQPYFPETEIAVLGAPDELGLEKIDLVVNTTSCGMIPPPVSRRGAPLHAQGAPSARETGGGMKGNADMPLDLKRLKNKASVYDLVYAPAETAFLKSAKELGWPAVNGLGMLAAQAALSFELWTGKKEGVREAMREALKTCPQ